MEKQLYVITYSSAHYAGAPSNCLVWATCEEKAEDLAEGFMQEAEFEQNYDQIQEDGLDDECAYTIDKVELLQGSEYEEYVKDKQQQLAYYPYVNSKD